jgi:predicted nucleotidyltransferase component of viral defense system
LPKLHFDPPGRYSEDIDLVQVIAGPIGPVMDAVRARLDPWLGKPQWKQGQGRATFFYRFESETKPITPLKLKLETNTREHFFVLGPRRARFQADTPWHSGAADVLTYEPEAPLGTKLRALYQRKKGRDLFDLSEALTRLPGLDADKVVACFTRYLENDGLRVSRMEFEENLVRKIEDKAFVVDVLPLLALRFSFDPAAALERVRDGFISRLPEGPSKKGKERRHRGSSRPARPRGSGASR